jgi:hypothetical protein
MTGTTLTNVMERSTMKLDPTSAAEIRELELSYTERVNMAVAEDRYDLIKELAESFDAELSQLREQTAA